jgi:hypothetical protein
MRRHLIHPSIKELLHILSVVFNIGVEREILPAPTYRADALTAAEITALTSESEDDVENRVAFRVT